MPPRRKRAANGDEASSKRAKSVKDTEDDGDETPEETIKSKGSKKPVGKANPNGPAISSLDFSCDAKTSDGKDWNLKLSAWNVNGIRAWIQKDGLEYIKKENPDIFCVSETKCSIDKMPSEAEVEGYKVYWLSGDADGYSGVGMYSKTEPKNVTYGIDMEQHDKEGRVITAEFDKFYLVTTYVPNAGKKLVRLDYRKEWDVDFRAYLKNLDKKKPVILCGDLNVSHQEIDIANVKGNKKNAGFSQEERDGFSELLNSGFVDTFRKLHPDETAAYTFWTYMMNARAKNVGWRLDYFVVSERLVPQVCESLIRKDVHGSDHCPVTLLLSI